MDTINQRSRNMFSDPGVVDGDEIDRIVDGAYAENVAAGRVVTPGFADDTAKSALAAQLDELDPREEEIKWPELDGMFAEHIALYERTFEETKKLFEHTGWKVPDPTDFMVIGTDLEALAEEYDRMKQRGAEPMMVIAPIYAGLDEWKLLYEQLAFDGTIPNNPLKGYGMEIYDQNGVLGEIKAKAETEMRNKLVRIPIVRTTGINGVVREWAMRIIPQAHSTEMWETHSISKSYPTINEYLAIQARRISEGKPPIDKEQLAATWLEGADRMGHHSYGSWYADTGKVVLAVPMSGDQAKYNRAPYWKATN